MAANQQTPQAPADNAKDIKDNKTTSSKKLKTGKIKDTISKGSTMVGRTEANPSGKTDQIDINPMQNENVLSQLNDIYDSVMNEIEENIDSMFEEKFGKWREAVPRSGQDRHTIDLTVRNGEDRKKDDRPYRQQSIVKKIIDEKYGKGYVSSASKIEKAMKAKGVEPNSSDKYRQEMEKNSAAYDAIKKKTNEDFEQLFELSPQLVGAVHRRHEIEGVPYKSKAAYDAVKNAVRKAAGIKKPGPYVFPDVDKVPPGIGMNEDLNDWFKDKWVRMDTKGNIKGDCAREPGEGKPKCLPVAKAKAMDKEDRAAAVRRKRREDPVADRPGKGGAPINVQTEAANPAQQAAIAIAMKKAGKKPKNEEYIQEKHAPTNSLLWSKAKSLAKQKFDVYPSAYANGWAVKWYKSKGGGWKSIEEDHDILNVQEQGCSIEEWNEELGLTEEIFTPLGNELYEDWGEIEEEAEHDGHRVKLGKPFHTPGGPKKRAVYVKNDKGNVVKVNFGDPHLSIKRDQPSRKKSYRARHHCETPGPRWKANYWSCKYWSSTPTSVLDKG
jgi:hypothetical protein